MLRDMQMALVRKRRRGICLHQYRQRVLRRLDGIRRFLRRLGGERMSKEYIERGEAIMTLLQGGCYAAINRINVIATSVYWIGYVSQQWRKPDEK